MNDYKQEAWKELARRELARREQKAREAQPQPSWLEDAANDVEQNIIKPVEAIPRTARDMAAGFGQGLANIAPGLYNLGASGANALGANVPKSPMLDFAPHNAAATTGEIGSFFAPGSIFKLLGKTPVFAHTAKSAMKIPMIAEGIKHASNILSKSPLATSVAGNAILGGAYAPENQLEGMALGAGGRLAGEGIGRAYNALRPSKLFRGNLSAKELENNLRITKGTETGLGDVIGSPMLKRFNENILSKIPFSGVNESMQRNAGNIINRGHELVEKFAGKGNIEDLDKYLNDAVQSAYKSHRGKKNAYYKEANDLSDQIGLKLELPSFAAQAKKYKNAIEDTNILKHDPDLQKLMSKVARYEKPVKTEVKKGMIVDQSGNPLINEVVKTYPRLKEANLLKGRLNTLAKQHGSSPNPSDQHLSGVFKHLAKTLKTDIVREIEKKGHAPLMDAYKAAEENYGKNFSSFLDKDIFKFANGNADAETLVSSFIKTGKSTDRANLIKKVTEKLPSKDRNLLGYSYLKRAMDENNVLNPLKLKTLLSKNALGDKQFKALFPDEKLRNALRDYISLVDKNTKGLKLMQNPDTGQMSMDILPLLSKSSGGFGAKLLASPLVAKKLRSEKTRNKLVGKMIENSSTK